MSKALPTVIDRHSVTQFMIAAEDQGKKCQTIQVESTLDPSPVESRITGLCKAASRDTDGTEAISCSLLQLILFSLARELSQNQPYMPFPYRKFSGIPIYHNQS